MVSIGDALHSFLKSANWQNRLYEMRIRDDWEIIMGTTIAKYTKDVKLYDHTLTIYTDMPVLKNELHLGKTQIIDNINRYLGINILRSVVVK